jgi:hypothetical protein
MRPAGIHRSDCAAGHVATWEASGISVPCLSRAAIVATAAAIAFLEEAKDRLIEATS